jgi:MFS superfamily sulfate permease-like transporter
MVKFSGFITAAAFHIGIGQLDQVMGVKKMKNTGSGYLFKVKNFVGEKLFGYFDLILLNSRT